MVRTRGRVIVQLEEGEFLVRELNICFNATGGYLSDSQSCDIFQEIERLVNRLYKSKKSKPKATKNSRRRKSLGDA